MRGQASASPAHPSNDGRATFSKIVLAVDSPERSEEAAEVALSMARANDADLIIVHVIPPSVAVIPPFGGGLPVLTPASIYSVNKEEQRRTSQWMSHFSWLAQQRRVASTIRILPADRPVAEQIVGVAEEDGADLIIMGTRERSSLDKIFFGSVSGEVIKKSRCPVMIVHEFTRSSPPEPQPDGTESEVRA